MHPQNPPISGIPHNPSAPRGLTMLPKHSQSDPHCLQKTHSSKGRLRLLLSTSPTIEQSTREQSKSRRRRLRAAVFTRRAYSPSAFIKLSSSSSIFLDTASGPMKFSSSLSKSSADCGLDEAPPLPFPGGVCGLFVYWVRVLVLGRRRGGVCYSPSRSSTESYVEHLVLSGREKNSTRPRGPGSY